MFGIHDLPLFIVSGLLLNITPGQDFAYIVSRSATSGWKGGAMAALGVGAGCFVHIFCAALGLSAILATSATAFTVIKLVGAAYMFYVGVTMILSARHKPAQAAKLAAKGTPAAVSLGVIFRQGFLTNALNPKVALFFLAFLPQFVSHESPHPALALLILGVIFSWNGTLWNLLVAWSTARLTSAMQRKTRTTDRVGAWCKAVAGSLFIGLGLKLAFSEME